MHRVESRRAGFTGLRQDFRADKRNFGTACEDGLNEGSLIGLPEPRPHSLNSVPRWVLIHEGSLSTIVL